MLRSPRKRLGVLHLDRGPMQEPFGPTEFYLADAVAANVSVGIESAQMAEQQRDEFVQTVTTLARAVELRDQYTGDHTRRVTDYALLLADELRLTPQERYHIQIGTPLHDIGKIGIDDAILRKPGRLTGDEDEVINEYRDRNPDFPHESTADQFFDEDQFESYRALGEHIGKQVIKQVLPKLN